MESQGVRYNQNPIKMKAAHTHTHTTLVQMDLCLRELRQLNFIVLTHSWSSALLEKLPIVQPLKNFPAFYGTRRFITAITRALH
jgi:hypothetical protein